MNTTLLKTFGQKARTLLIDGVTRKLHYWGFDKDGAVTESPEPLPGGFLFREAVYDDATVPHLWQSLKEAINKEGLHEVAERAAYIWFNRLMALQILGKNGYEQPLLEPVSVEEQTPVIVKRARGGQYDFLNKTEQERLKKILTDYEKETQAFAILLIGFCHNHSLLNRVFGSIDDYTELLLPDDILSSGGFLDLLNNGDYITDDDYSQVELIGWLYQFYISEKKDQVFKKFKDGKKAEAKDIPAATQIFTPNWIVKYMVENTVGKIWLEKHPHSPIKESLKYLVEAAEIKETPEPIIEEVKDLKLLDPASGSGHILVEGFELLYKMYLEEYYPADEAVESILQNNLYGLDIDLRAAQLAQFAVLMKAAQYHPNVLKKDIIPHIYAMPVPVHFTKEDVQLFLGEKGATYVKPLQDALHLMLQAQNLGSIMQFDISEEARTHILKQLKKWQERIDLDLLQQELLTKLTSYLQVLELLTQQYEAIAANPPYMGQRNMNGVLKDYVSSKFKLGKNDLMTVFMELIPKLTVKKGFFSLINLPSWLFLSSFEQLRKYYLEKYNFQSLLHMGRGIFGIDFGSVVFSIKKEFKENSIGSYYRLHERNFQHIHYEDIKKLFLISKRNPVFKFDFNSYQEFGDVIETSVTPVSSNAIQISYPKVQQLNFSKVPGSPIAYWVSEKIINVFQTNTLLIDVADLKRGMTTSDNDRFLRFWAEVSKSKIGFGIASHKEAQKSRKKWFPYNKGGFFRKWYGCNEYLVNWENDGYEVIEFAKAINKSYTRTIVNVDYYFKKSITWPYISSGAFGVRFLPEGYIYDSGGPSLFIDDEKKRIYLCALMNSKVVKTFLPILNPTVNYQIADIARIPIKDEFQPEIEKLALENYEITKKDWDNKETSWDFRVHPIISIAKETLKESYIDWYEEIKKDFTRLYKNEEKLNEIFISIYDLKNELDTTVPLDEITILQDEVDFQKIEGADNIPILKDVVIQNLISYIIGCVMGRYRLDKLGLQVAHPNPTIEELERYTYTSQVTGENHLIEIDEDGIIPLMGNKGNFRDDAYNRLRRLLVAVWGEGTLTQNINFIQDCLNQDLEDYLSKKFWSYHVRTYSKKPIYWLFSSKKGAFQALVYLHRMNRFTAEKLRDKYLLKHIQFLEQEITRMEGNMTTLTKSDQKKLDQLRKDLQECNDYDLLLKDIATKQIEFDLDDGVTRNYELFKGVVAPIK